MLYFNRGPLCTNGRIVYMVSISVHSLPFSVIGYLWVRNKELFVCVYLRYDDWFVAGTNLVIYKHPILYLSIKFLFLHYKKTTRRAQQTPPPLLYFETGALRYNSKNTKFLMSCRPPVRVCRRFF